jgi:hypothetical protein
MLEELSRMPRSRFGVGMRGTLDSFSSGDPFTFANTATSLADMAAFVFANVSPDGLPANRAPAFSDNATFVFEKLSPDGLLAKNPVNLTDKADLAELRSLLIIGVPLAQLAPLLLLLKQKKSAPAIARNPTMPKTAPTTAPAAILLPSAV